MRHINSLLSSLLIVLFVGIITSCQTSDKNKNNEPIKSSIQAIDGVTITYDVRGDAETALVFIHGWCSNRTFWKEQLDEMAKQYRVVAIDLPGHGESGRNREKWSITSFAEDVETVVESLDLKQVILIGHSMGGLVALEAAPLLPDVVIGVIGIDAISNVESENQPDMMERVIAAFEADFEGTMNAFVPRLFSANTDSTIVQWVAKSSAKADKVMALSIMRGVSEIDEKNLLSSAGVPVRCVYAASEDPSGPQSYVEINKKYADFDAVFVDGVGHFLYLENPDEVNRHLLAFIKEIENISH
jgi:pimeloyl-ACP methyl ester carboxylesterase